jgi:hypothetical protein
MKCAMINRMMLVAFLLVFARLHAQTDPLPSWNDGPAKKAIVEFVKVTTEKNQLEVCAVGGAHRYSKNQLEMGDRR